MKYFNPLNPGWHDEPFDGAVEVSDEDHAALYAGPFPLGKMLAAVAGKVAFVDAPPKSYTDEELAEIVRATRDSLITKHIDKINAVRWASFSDAEQAAVSDYRTAILDVPQQAGFPRDVAWPAVPEFLL